MPMMPMMRAARCFSAVFSVLFLAPLVQAQQPADQQGFPSIRVMGEGSVSVKPDQARIDIGVVTQGESADSATKENARRVTSVLNDIHRVLGPGGDVKTVGYSVTPLYRYPKDGKPVISGYSAANTVEVTVRDLDKVGPVIDAATQAGANNVQRLQFMLKNEASAYLEALRNAVSEAKNKAEAVASALGVRIVRIQQVEESAPFQQPPMAFAVGRAMAAEAAAPTPVESGTVEVRARVSLAAEIAR